MLTYLFISVYGAVRAPADARRFKVISGQKIEGAWYLKQMRIEAPAGATKDKTPTYLEVDGVER